MSKNKKSTKGPAKTSATDEDDWEAVLAAEAAVNATLAPVVDTTTPAKGPAQAVSFKILLSLGQFYIMYFCFV